jgi:hypothetical protein
MESGIMTEIIEFLTRADSTATHVLQTVLILLALIWVFGYIAAMFMEPQLNKDDDMDIFGSSGNRENT